MIVGKEKIHIKINLSDIVKPILYPNSMQINIMFNRKYALASS